MGDGGAYLFGTFTALNVIETNNLNPNISSFFIAFYYFIYFLKFFSFFRKLYQKKSPIKPDSEHLTYAFL